jgi:hypothetical protein
MSSKSTPLNQLSQNSNNDSTLVNEILAEIGNDDSSKQNEEDVMREKLYQQQVLEQQMLEQQEMMAQQQEMLQQQQQELENSENKREEDTPQKEQNESKFSLGGVAFEGKLKAAVIVGAICIALGIPTVNEMISKLLPNKPFIMNNVNIVVGLVKGILAAIIFYFAGNC